MSLDLRRIRDSLWLMVFFALFLRVTVACFVYDAQLIPRQDHWTFGFETGRIARAIASGRGFSDPLFAQTGPTAWMAPVYPYLVAGVFERFGIFTKASALAILWLQGLFSALTCLPVYFIARKSFGPRVAAWAGWVWAMFPYAIYYSTELVWSTSFTALLLSLLFLITLYLTDTTRLDAWGGFGLLWGFAGLTDPSVLSLFPFLVGWVCYHLRGKGQAYGLPAALSVAALLAVLTPWFIRNYTVFHQFIPLRDNLGLELYVWNDGDDSYHIPPAKHPTASAAELEEYNRLGELRYMAEKRRQALDYISHHLGWFARKSLRRFQYTWTAFWGVTHDQPIEFEFEPARGFDPVNTVLYTTLTVLALMGFRRALLHDAAGALPYALVLLVFPLLYYFTQAETRYRHAIDPQLVILAVCALVAPQPRATKSPHHRV